MRGDLPQHLGHLLHHMHPRALLTGPSDPNPAGETFELVSTPWSAAYQINRAVMPDEILIEAI